MIVDPPLRSQPFDHDDGSECPTFYDGCNCTLQTLSEAFERIDELEMQMKSIVPKIKKIMAESQCSLCRMVKLGDSDWVDHPHEGGYWEIMELNIDIDQ
jgi:hypothetical protein